MATTRFELAILALNGEVQVRHVSGDSETQVRQIVAASDGTIIRCTPLSDAVSSQHWLRSIGVKHNPKQFDTLSFSQDFATLLEAGVSVKEALAALTAREPSRARRQVLEELSQAIVEGQSLSSAMRRSSTFPPLLIATLAAGEQTGDLATGLSRFAHHQRGLRAVRDRVISACVYPMLLLVVGSAVVSLLLTIVVPKFASLLDGAGADLPLMSRVLMQWGRYADAHPSAPALLLLCSFAAIAAVVIQLRNSATRSRILERVPFVKAVLREFQHLQLYRTSATLTARGITIHKALALGIDLLGSKDRPRLRTALDLMRTGAPISVAMATSGLSDIAATSMLSVAERTGSMPEMLDRIADFYEQTLQRNIDVVSRLVEPVLMIVFGLLIGGIVILMYLPIFDLASHIG